jgi:hypothetical protein
VNRDCPTLDYFVRDAAIVPHIRNPQTFHFLWDRHLLDRVPVGIESEDIGYMEEVDAHLLAIPEGERLKRALFRLNRFAFVGLTEQLEPSLRLLAFTFGWRDFEAIPRLNSAPRERNISELAADTVAVIRQLTRLDAELYSRAQRLLAERLQAMWHLRSIVPHLFSGVSSKRSHVLP